MIKATELRIGNLVFNDPYTHEVWIDDFICQEYKDNKNVFEYFNPIPLTNEWLIRFGFCKSNRLFYSIKVGENFDISICITKGPSGCFGSVAFESLEFNKVLGRMTGTCNYVHQLQNLYFSLTGEELKLNEL